MRARIAVSILIATVLVGFVYAQSRPGEIHGVVTDVAGAAIPGVQVTLAGPETRSTATDARGELAFRNLPPQPTRSASSDELVTVNIASSLRGFETPTR